MKNKRTVRALSVVLGAAVCATALPFAACTGAVKDSIVVMAEEFSGLFNPFYATAGADMDVVGYTQIGMLTTDKNGDVVAGDEYSTVVKDYDIEPKNNETVYTFVIKNGLKFSDGVPLTINDVIFNMYEYLDPVYTGSSTMYSIKIKGLSQYRTQSELSGDGSSEKEESISTEAYKYAQQRRNEIISIFTDAGKTGSGTSTSYWLEKEDMLAAIDKWTPSESYKTAVSAETLTDDEYRAKMKEDYEFVRTTYMKELESDFSAAKESYDITTLPYSEHANKFKSDTFKFFLYEGYITPKYVQVQGKDDKEHIEKFEGENDYASYNTKEKAIQRVFDDNINGSLHNILRYYATAGDVLTQFSAEAKEAILHRNSGGTQTSGLDKPRIEGIRSLGHPNAKAGHETVQSVTLHKKEGNGTTYKVAQEHNADGSPAKADEYDVLQVTIDGQDPKAIYNFSFTVAPVHYYTADSENPNGRKVDIANDEFGVEFASTQFQGKVIQSLEHVQIPVGAGPFKATNANNGDKPTGGEFWSSNTIYYKKNDNFMFPVKSEKFQLQYVSSTNALDSLQHGQIDFATPQFTKANAERLDKMAKNGYEKLSSWQLGYGYIGINAGKIPNVYVRRSIMAAMNTSLAIGYYQSGTCRTLNWPMSDQSWAYPKDDDGVTTKNNGHDYTYFTNDDAAKAKIQNLFSEATNAGKQINKSDLKIKFTIAGSSITEHPTYSVFKHAAELLNSMTDLGWDVEVKADSQALTKLSTGSLEVWAAAWGSTIDPDMYQVYHKNSSATSVFAWGYREILADTTTYSYEYDTITRLSVIIDNARSTTVQSKRIPMYEEAMRLVLDLAVEMPVYQRQNLYAYNSKTLKGVNPNVNPYTSPLEEVWNLELAK